MTEAGSKSKSYHATTTNPMIHKHVIKTICKRKLRWWRIRRLLKCTENKAIGCTLQQRKSWGNSGIHKHVLLELGLLSLLCCRVLCFFPISLYRIQALEFLHLPTLLMVANSKLIKNALMPQPGKIRHFQGCIPAVPCEKDQQREEVLRFCWIS